MKHTKEIQIQRSYYADTAAAYNSMHVDEGDEHFLALALMVGALDYLRVRSILDIGSGTGRVLSYIKRCRPDLRIIGIEPVKELREIGHASGLSQEELLDGDATDLQFGASDFDLVCEFGVLHHIRNPDRAVAEMLRVAGRAVFISDSNNFGQGSATARSLKQIINYFGLWRFANYVKTKGKGYSITDGDGLAYSYSVFNNYEQIKRQCKSIHCLNTKDGSLNPYATACHVALLGIKNLN